jgi:hypothetical protein
MFEYGFLVGMVMMGQMMNKGKKRGQISTRNVSKQLKTVPVLGSFFWILS